MHMKISFTKWWPFCRGRYELKPCDSEFNLGRWKYTFQFSIISQHWDGAVGWQPRIILHDQYRYHGCWWVDTLKFSPFEISRDLLSSNTGTSLIAQEYNTFQMPLPGCRLIVKMEFTWPIYSVLLSFQVIQFLYFEYNVYIRKCFYFMPLSATEMSITSNEFRACINNQIYTKYGIW